MERFHRVSHFWLGMNGTPDVHQYLVVNITNVHHNVADEWEEWQSIVGKNLPTPFWYAPTSQVYSEWLTMCFVVEA